MMYRGFAGTLPWNTHNPLLNHNPRGVYESDMLTFTTDNRMTKAGELLLPGQHATGGGEPVEMCFWIGATQNQWRVRGRCYLLAEEDADESPAVTDVLQKRMRPTAAQGGDEERNNWSWAKEVQVCFSSLCFCSRALAE